MLLAATVFRSPATHRARPPTLEPRSSTRAAESAITILPESPATVAPWDEETWDPHEPPEDQVVIERLHAFRLSLAFEGAPLPAIIDHLREVAGLNFLIDRTSIPSPEDEQTTISGNDVTVEDALRCILPPLGLAHVVEGGVVVIAARERIRSCVYLELYDVQDFTWAHNGWNEFNGPGPLSGDDLVRLARRETGDDWPEERGASIQFQNGLLIVRNTREVHARVAAFLECVRANPESWALAYRR